MYSSAQPSFTFNPTAAKKSTELNVLLVYENLSAALWVADALTSLQHELRPDEAVTRLSPWSFSTLANPEYRAQAMAIARNADLIVITTSSGFRLLPPSLEAWLGQCLAAPRHVHAAVAAFFGSPALPDGGDSMRLQAMERLAKDAGCRFFAPCATEAALSSA